MEDLKVSVEEVKRYFLLANTLKERARHHKELGLTVLNEEYQREFEYLKSLDDSRLSSRITDKVRLKRYDSMDWHKGNINLEKAGVWPKMQGADISLTLKNLPDTAENLFKDIDNPLLVPEKLKLKINSLRDLSEFVYERLPLIFYPGGEVREKDYNVWARENNEPLCKIYDFDIDDGCSRAVAYLLEGVKIAPVLFAKYKD